MTLFHITNFATPEEYADFTRDWHWCVQKRKHMSVSECKCPFLQCCLSNLRYDARGIERTVPITEILGFEPYEMAMELALACNKSLKLPDDIAKKIIWKWLQELHMHADILDLRFQHYCMKRDVMDFQNEIESFEGNNHDLICYGAGGLGHYNMK